MDNHTPNPNLEPAEDVSETKDLNTVQRIVGIFFSPGSTFAQIDRKPDWIVPLIILTLATVGFTILTLPIILPEQMAKQREVMEERNMSSDQIDKAMAIGEKVGRIMGPIGAAISPSIGLLVMALILWFIGTIILKGQTTFLKVFSVCTYTSLIGVLDLLIKAPLILIKKTIDVQFNLALLLPENLTDTLLHDMLTTFDVFTLWRTVVLALGFAVIYRFSLYKAGWTMAILFFISMALKVAMLQLPGH